MMLFCCVCVCVHVCVCVCVCVFVCLCVWSSAAVSARCVCEMSSPHTAVCMHASSPSSLICISASHHVARTTSSVHQRGQKTSRQQTHTHTHTQTRTQTHINIRELINVSHQANRGTYIYATHVLWQSEFQSKKYILLGYLHTHTLTHTHTNQHTP